MSRTEEIVEHICANQEMSAKNWLFSMHETLTHEHFTKMIVTMWAIRKARRKAIHEEIIQSPFSTDMFINSFLSELQILEKPKATFIKSGPIRRNHWLVAPKGLCKINVDAALTRNEPIGVVGALCRDH